MPAYASAGALSCFGGFGVCGTRQVIHEPRLKRAAVMAETVIGTSLA